MIGMRGQCKKVVSLAGSCCVSLSWRGSSDIYMMVLGGKGVVAMLTIKYQSRLPILSILTTSSSIFNQWLSSFSIMLLYCIATA